MGRPGLWDEAQVLDGHLGSVAIVLILGPCSQLWSQHGLIFLVGEVLEVLWPWLVHVLDFLAMGASPLMEPL
jgi:hypothetical protein